MGVWIVGELGGMNREIGTDMCTAMLNTETSGNLQYGAESSARCSVMTKTDGMEGRWAGDARGKQLSVCIEQVRKQQLELDMEQQSGSK